MDLTCWCSENLFLSDLKIVCRIEILRYCVNFDNVLRVMNTTGWLADVDKLLNCSLVKIFFQALLQLKCTRKNIR